MLLSKKALDDFKKIWKKKFNEEISDDEANEKGMQLLSLMKLIYKPIPHTKKAEYQSNKDTK